MTRSAADAALLCAAMLGDGAAARAFAALAATEPEASLAGVRIAVLPADQFPIAVEPDVAAGVGAAASVLRALGAEVTERRFPFDFDDLMRRNGQLTAAEAWSVHRAYVEDERLPIGPGVRRRVLGGKAIAAADYIDALAHRRAARRQWVDWMQSCDALLTPTVPMAACPVEAVDETATPLASFTRAGNYLDACALSLPAGFNRQGLPFGAQLLGRPGSETHAAAHRHRVPARHRLAPAHARSRAARCAAESNQGRHHVRSDDRRQPAQTLVAGGDAQAVAAVEGAGRRTGGGEARRDAGLDQGAGRRGPGHRDRRRAVAAALRPRLPRSGRRHRLRAQGRDGHPQRPLQGDGAAGRRAAEAEGPRARNRGPVRARAHEEEAEDHDARPDDDRRHRGRPPLRRRAGGTHRDGDGVRGPAEPGSAGARGRRRRHRAVRRAGVQRLHEGRQRVGPEGARARGRRAHVHDRGPHLLRLRHQGEHRLEEEPRRGVAPVRGDLPRDREELDLRRCRSSASTRTFRWT